ncbi:MAG: AAA family ATPase [archaeon]
MRIDFVEMKNFRQYANVKINFADSHGKSFTIVKGPNGAGKTNLMNAITWCLFGDELHVSKYKGLPIVNTTILENTPNGNFVDVRVDIQFEKDDGKKILISRAIRYQLKNGKKVERPLPHPSPSIMWEGKRDWSKPIYGADAQTNINNMIPKSIEEYFFFDGERMNDYFKKNTGKDIKQAVNEISQIELLETMIKHLTIRKSAFVSMAKGMSSNAKEKTEFIEAHEKSLIIEKDELKKLELEKNTAEMLEIEYSEKLKNSSLEYIQRLENDRRKIKSEIENLEEEIEALEGQELKLLHKSMHVLLTQDALLTTKNFIEFSKAAGKIPPKYEKIFIQTLLDKEKCLCDSDISERDKYSIERRKKVESYLDVGRLPEISSDIIETNALIREMFEDLSEFENDVVTIGKRSKSLQKIVDNKKMELKKISAKISKSEKDDIRKWESERKKNSELKNFLIGKIALLNDRIERRERIIRVTNNAIDRELEKGKKHESLLKIRDFCDTCIKCAEQIKQTIMKNVKEEIENKTSQQFLDLIWKKDTFEGVKIDENYNISVPHITGRESLGTLSAGETQVCALSFMAALNSVSGFDVPLIIDTPLARISSEPRVAIAKNLPNYLEGKQVTLLVTDEEFTSDVKDALQPKVDKIYQIFVEEKKRGNLAEVILLNE